MEQEMETDGKVLSQSDYRPKELSTGEYAQPVLGVASSPALAYGVRDGEVRCGRMEYSVVKYYAGLLSIRR